MSMKKEVKYPQPYSIDDVIAENPCLQSHLIRKSHVRQKYQAVNGSNSKGVQKGKKEKYAVPYKHLPYT